MPMPPDGPATPTGVQAIVQTDASDAADLEAVVAAVNSLVRTWPCTVDATYADVDPAFPAHVVRGSDMLAARLFRRRNSVSGVEAFGAEGPVYVQRNDPDVAMLLGLGAWERPGVA